MASRISYTRLVNTVVSYEDDTGSRDLSLREALDDFLHDYDNDYDGMNDARQITITITVVGCTCCLGCAESSPHSGWHQHKSTPCPVHTAARVHEDTNTPETYGAWLQNLRPKEPT